MSREVRETVSNFWEMVAFFANSVAFIFLGLTMNIINMGEELPLIIFIFVVVLFGRALFTYPILTLINKFTREKIYLYWQNVIFIGGMSGAVSVALVTSLPQSEMKGVLEAIKFGVVLLSLIL